MYKYMCADATHTHAGACTRSYNQKRIKNDKLSPYIICYRVPS